MILTTPLMCLVLATSAGAAEAPLFHVRFNEPGVLESWSGSGGDVAVEEGVLRVRQASADGSALRLLPLPASLIDGKLVTLEARVKAEGVSDRPQPWNGVKVMLVLQYPQGKQHPQLPLEVGTYDWTRVARTIRVPKGVAGVSLVLGLERVSGTAWFDDVTLTAGRPAWAGSTYRGEMDRGHSLSRLRGAMHGPRFREEDFRVLASTWGANHMRWQLNWVPMKAAEEWAQDLRRYDEWLEGALAECDRAVDLAEKLGVLLLVDLHCPPGGRAGGGVCRMFQQQRYQQKLLEVWDRIARRYKGRKAVWAYDLINEPVEGRVAPGLMNWRELATKAAQTIRAVDPGKPVVVEPGPWGGPGGFDDFLPLPLDRVIYSFHMYLPHSFTHQGVHGLPVGQVYPGVIDGVYWDKERLREALQPARDFQLAFNVPMYIGEFSAVRWAPDNSAYRYLKDVIDLFEEYGWDWAYHSFREFDGWSAEHDSDPNHRQRSSTPTDREQLLRRWFARNERPQW
ncbi:MAG: cellulase family glycosylhydrolase [Armatimonadota bacterium]|nr:cellulase family glycosylhydrolase [Armatimonadota bacterium]